MLSVKVSAPGKIILHGEHSVVYGKLAVAGSLGLRTRANLQEVEGQEVVVELPSLNLTRSYNLQTIKALLDKPIPLQVPSQYDVTHPELIQHDQFLKIIESFVRDNEASSLDPKQQHALISFFYIFRGIVNTQNVPFTFRVTSDLSIGAGTGSSASFAVATSAAFLYYSRLKTKDESKTFNKSQLELISKWAYQSEKVIHGTPSGVDNTVCTYGGLVAFRTGASPKIIELPTKFSVILINTNVSRDTKTLVRKVATLREQYPTIVGGILDLIDVTTNEALECIQELDYGRLGVLTDFNQNLLKCLGVSHPKLDEICQILVESGLHGKLTGAGGGGYAISVVPPNFDNNVLVTLIDNLNSKGFNATLTDLGGEGICIDKINL